MTALVKSMEFIMSIFHKMPFIALNSRITLLDSPNRKVL